MIAVSADSQAFLVGQARLLDVDVHVANRADDAQRVVHQPACISISDKPVAKLEHCANGANALDVSIRVAANLELKSAVTFGPVTRDTLCHRLGRFLRDGAIQTEVSAVSPAQQDAHRLTRDLPEEVPASHVDAGLDV